ncbi:DUF4038 domain-containing protein [Paenibacillus sp. J5C_2022]|uniref:apiosidase-like domain-containing protein n=1 Tax=Paenibacillus sp. J5C2022 TaxID=2977129 RepID=UPI0021CF2EEF|nr:DUF4038 domain-containing protein [Paenibacillus sp. J5C2022]MCU6712722.1 DUF4038 domain-containing protein [Paenibacillus sp. J5C2022]
MTRFKKWCVTTVSSLFMVSLLFLLSSMVFKSLVLANSYETETWKVVEITLTSSNTYANPYLDVDVNATFSGPDNTVMTVPGFWDGGNTWKIRFAPTIAGIWSYETLSSDPTNAGLHNQFGTVTSSAYTGNLDIYKHGWSLKKSSNNRYLTYTDGKPFFWLGDTHWMGLSGRERLFSSNDGRWASEFKGMADTRISQGYTVYQMNFFSGEVGDISLNGTMNEGGHPWNRTGYAKGQSSFSYNLASSASGGWDYAAGKAIDGNIGTKWVAANGSFPQWMYIDLGQVKTLSKVETQFGIWDSWHYQIEGSADGISYSTIIDRTFGITGDVFTDLTTASARYVRLQITGSGSSTASVKEFKVYDSSNELLNNQGLFKELNPSFWQNADLRIQYLAEKGFITALGLDWGRAMEAANKDDYKKIAKYIVARYGAYPVMWYTAGEYDLGYSEGWKEVASHIRDNDAYNRALTLHNTVNNYNSYRNETFYDIDFLQGGHGGLRANSYWLDQYAESPTKPIIEAEFNYENILNIPSFYTREVAYKSLFNGAAGYVYGANGIWQATWNPEDEWQANQNSPTPWYVAIDNEAGAQMRYLRDLFTSLDWASLSPGAAIAWSGAPSGTQEPAQLANEDRSLVLAYLPSNVSAYTGIVNGLSPSSTYMARWFNTRNGNYTMISDGFLPNGSGQWSIPAQPDSTKDWVIIIQNITDRVQRPVLSMSGGSFTGSVNLSLSTSTLGASIYYTLDGSTPTTNSTLYSSAISLSDSKTLKAIAVKSGMTNSVVTTEYYNKRVDSLPTASESGGMYTSSQVIALSTIESDAQIFYTLDGSVPTDTNGLNYHSPIEIDRTMPLKAIVKKRGHTSSPVMSHTYTILSSDLLSQGKLATSSSANSGNGASMAVDGNTSTSWVASSGSMPQWIKIDLGDVYDLTYMEQTFLTPYLTWKYKIEGSNDDVTYTTLVDRTTVGVKGVNLLERLSGSARYVKLTITQSSTGDWATSKELKIYGKRLPGALLSQGKTVTSSTSNPGAEASKALDGNFMTYWCATSGAMPQWLMVDLGQPYELAYINQIFYTPNLTWKYKIEGSLDNMTYFTLVDRTGTGVNGTDLIESVDATARFVKLTVTESSTGDWATSREFRVYGKQAASAYWKLDEGSGATANDFSGNLNTGTLVNGASWTTGIVNGAVSLDGMNDYVNIPDSVSLDGMGRLTVSAWVNLSQLPATNYFPVEKSSLSGAYRFVINSAGKGHFVIATDNNAWYSTGTVADFTTEISPNVWYHLVGVYDGTNVLVYVNGQLAGTGAQPISGSVVNEASPLRFGYMYGSNGEYLKGKIDDVRIYGIALTPAEVLHLFQHGSM